VPPLLEAQEPVQRPGYHPTWWTTEDGLPGNFVSDLTQGVDGRLWLVAGGVLTRFDGQAFEVVPVGESMDPEAPMEFPIAVAKGAGDTLWVSTYANRLLARTRGLWVERFRTENRLEELVVRPGVPPAGRENADSAIYVWQGGHRLAATRPGRFQAPARPSLAVDPGGSLWAIEWGEPFAASFSADTPGRLEVATRRFVRSSSGEGPLGVRRAGGRLEITDADGRVRAAIPYQAGRVPLLITRDGRVVASTPEDIEVFDAGDPRPERITLQGGGPVLVAFEDREEGLWFGTDSGGLLHLHRAPFEVFAVDVRGDGPGPVQIIGPGQGGSVLAIADGVARIRGSRSEPVRLEGIPDDAAPFAAMEDRRGTIWLSLVTSDEGILVHSRSLDGSVRRFTTAAPVVEFVEAPDGSMLWLTEAEFCKVSGAPGTAGEPACADLGRWGARDLLVARNGTVWIAGDQGVMALGPNGVRSYTPEEGYPLVRARALHEDIDGILWIGTYYGGLGRLAGDSLRMIRRADGLAEDVVSNILEDGRGNLWMGGNEGIHSVSKASIEAFLDGEAPQVSSLSFGRKDGLPNPEGSGRQGVRTADGRLWFPTFGGALALHPDWAEGLIVAHAPLVFDRITAPGQAYPIGDTVRLPAGIRDLEITVASVSLQAPGTEILEYSLEGSRTPGWTFVRDDRTILLSDLPPGTPRLRVRATAPDTRPVSFTSELVLVVPPRFTETGWFPALLISAIAALVLLAVRFRTRLLERRAAELEAEVREQTHWLEVERDRTAAALEKAAETGSQLRELLVTKSRVFAGLSHELRTPMSLILAPLRELDREASGAFPPTARAHLGTLRNAVQRLERLTAQFLDLADTQSGTLRLEKKEVEVGAFLNRCVEAMRPVAEGKRVRVTVNIPTGGSQTAEMDPDHMDKVVVNLLGNGIQHAPAGGKVEVVLLHDDDEATMAFEVRDNGPGVPPEYLDRIFDPFFQAPGATGGMGLGLSFSRDVVVLHGGRIEVESSPENGAVFRVILPLRGPVGPEPAGAPVAPASPTPARGAASSEDGRLQPQDRVLVVEDEVELRGFLVEQFRKLYDARGAGSGEEALELIREWTPNLVISDILMPGLDGIGLCRILKADPATRGIPFVLLTARGDRDHQVQGLASGADDYVVKPFDTEQLSLRVANLLQLRRGIEDRFRDALPAWASILFRAGIGGLDTSSETFLERLYEVLVEGIGNPDLDVDGIAKALFLSRSSLYRRVRELLDCSPLDLLAEVRLEQAALLLRTTTEPVGGVASRVGFRNAEHFSRRFVAHFGLTPRAYRSHQGGR